MVLINYFVIMGLWRNMIKSGYSSDKKFSLTLFHQQLIAQIHKISLVSTGGLQVGLRQQPCFWWSVKIIV